MGSGGITKVTLEAIAGLNLEINSKRTVCFDLKRDDWCTLEKFEKMYMGEGHITRTATLLF
jgi:hypothetical protein